MAVLGLKDFTLIRLHYASHSVKRPNAAVSQLADAEPPVPHSMYVVRKPRGLRRAAHAARNHSANVEIYGATVYDVDSFEIPERWRDVDEAIRIMATDLGATYTGSREVPRFVDESVDPATVLTRAKIMLRFIRDVATFDTTATLAAVEDVIPAIFWKVIKWKYGRAFKIPLSDEWTQYELSLALRKVTHGVPIVSASDYTTASIWARSPGLAVPRLLVAREVAVSAGVDSPSVRKLRGFFDGLADRIQTMDSEKQRVTVERLTRWVEVELGDNVRVDEHSDFGVLSTVRDFISSVLSRIFNSIAAGLIAALTDSLMSLLRRLIDAIRAAVNVRSMVSLSVLVGLSIVFSRLLDWPWYGNLLAHVCVCAGVLLIVPPSRVFKFITGLDWASTLNYVISGPNIVVEEHAGNDVYGPMAGLVASLALLLSGVESARSKRKLTGLMSVLTAAAKAGTAAETLAKLLPIGVAVVRDYLVVTWETGNPLVGLRVDFAGRTRALENEISEKYAQFHSLGLDGLVPTMMADAPFRRQLLTTLDDAYALAKELRVAGLAQTPRYADFFRLLDSYKLLYSNVRALDGFPQASNQPFTVLITGKSGIAKSTLAPILVQQIAGNPNATTYTYPVGDAYVSGYDISKTAMLFDDLGQLNDNSGSSDLSTCFRVCGRGVHLLNMPSITPGAAEGVKGTPFASPIVMALSNSPYPKADVREPIAFKRRFIVSIHLRRKGKETAMTTDDWREVDAQIPAEVPDGERFWWAANHVLEAAYYPQVVRGANGDYEEAVNYVGRSSYMSMSELAADLHRRFIAHHVAEAQITAARVPVPNPQIDLFNTFKPDIVERHIEEAVGANENADGVVGEAAGGCAADGVASPSPLEVHAALVAHGILRPSGHCCCNSRWHLPASSCIPYYDALLADKDRTWTSTAWIVHRWRRFVAGWHRVPVEVPTETSGAVVGELAKAKPPAALATTALIVASITAVVQVVSGVRSLAKRFSGGHVAADHSRASVRQGRPNPRGRALVRPADARANLIAHYVAEHANMNDKAEKIFESVGLGHVSANLEVSSLASKIAQNQIHLSVVPVSNAALDRDAFGLIVCGRVAMAPAHLFLRPIRKGPDGPEYERSAFRITVQANHLYTTEPKLDVVSFELRACDLITANSENGHLRDVVWFELPMSVRLHTDLTHYFADYSESCVSAVPAALVVKGTIREETLAVPFARDIATDVDTPAGVVSVMRAAGDDKSVLAPSWVSSPGSCGLVYIAPWETHPRILGIHSGVCHGAERAYLLSGVTAETLAAVIDTIDPVVIDDVHMIAMPLDSSAGVEPPTGDFDIIGGTRPVKSELRSDIHVSGVFANICGHVTSRGPAVTDTKHPMWKQFTQRYPAYARKLPVTKAYEKYANVQRELRGGNLLVVAADDLAGTLFKPHPRDNIRLFTLDEVLLGSTDVDRDNVQPATMNTSPGIVYSRIGLNDKHQLVSVQSDGTLSVHKLLRQRYQTRFALASQRARLADSPWKSIPKVELRPIDKVNNAKTRHITVPPFDYTLFGSSLLGGVSAKLKRERITNGSAIGINPESPEWNQLAHWLLEIKPRVVVGLDVTAMDANLNSEMIAGVLRIIMSAMRPFLDELSQSNSAMVQRSLNVFFEELVHPTEVIANALIRKAQGNSSGNPFTSELNTIATHLVMRLCQVKWAIANVGTSCYEDVLSHIIGCVRAIAYGDDQLTAIAAPAYDAGFNEDFIMQVYEDNGLPVRVECRSEAGLDNVVFLKRKFVVLPEFQDWAQEHQLPMPYYSAQLDLDVVYDILHWCKASNESTLLIAARMASAQIFAFFHGRDVFDTLAAAIRDRLAVKPHLLANVLTWEHLWQWMEDGTLAAKAEAAETADWTYLRDAGVLKAAMESDPQGKHTSATTEETPVQAPEQNGEQPEQKPDDQPPPRVKVEEHAGDASDVNESKLGVTHVYQTPEDASDSTELQNLRHVQHHLTEPSWAVSEELGKARLMTTFAWTTQEPTNTVLWTARLPSWLMDGQYSSEWAWAASRFTYFNFKYIRLHVSCNAGPNYAGKIIAYFVPLSETSIYDEVYSLKSLVSLRNVVLDASSGTASVLDIPFTTPAGALSCADMLNEHGDQGFFPLKSDIGSIVFRVWNPLRTGTDVPAADQKVEVAVTAEFIGANMMIPRAVAATAGRNMRVTEHMDSCTDVHQSVPEAENPLRPVEDIIGAVSGAVGSVTKVAETLLPLGLDSRRDPTVSRVYREQGINYANADVTQHVNRMSLHDATLQHSLPDHFGSGLDEQTFSRIAQRPGRLITLQWTPSQPSGALLFAAPVCPNFGQTNLIDRGGDITGQLQGNTPVEYIGGAFRYWKGGFKVKIQAVGTRFHRGSLVVAMHYGVKNLSTLNQVMTSASNAYCAYVRLTDGVGETTLSIPYQSPWPWLNHPLYDSNATNVAIPYYKSPPPDLSTSTLGFITVHVVNTLAGPMPNTVAPIVDINVIVSGAEDFRVHMPIDMTNYNSSYTLAQSTLAPGRYQKQPRPARNMVVEEHAFENIEKVSETDTQQSAEATLARSGLHLAPDPHFGESAKDLRDTLRRMTMVATFAIPDVAAGETGQSLISVQQLLADHPYFALGAGLFKQFRGSVRVSVVVTGTQVRTIDRHWLLSVYPSSVASGSGITDLIAGPEFSSVTFPGSALAQKLVGSTCPVATFEVPQFSAGHTMMPWAGNLLAPGPFEQSIVWSYGGTNDDGWMLSIVPLHEDGTEEEYKVSIFVGVGDDFRMGTEVGVAKTIPRIPYYFLNEYASANAFALYKSQSIINNT